MTNLANTCGKKGCLDDFVNAHVLYVKQNQYHLASWNIQFSTKTTFRISAIKKLRAINE